MKLVTNKLAIFVGILALTGSVALAAPVVNQTLGTWGDTFGDDDGLAEMEATVVSEGSITLDVAPPIVHDDGADFHVGGRNGVNFSGGGVVLNELGPE